MGMALSFGCAGAIRRQSDSTRIGGPDQGAIRYRSDQPA
jgi:hypothetical protein